MSGQIPRLRVLVVDDEAQFSATLATKLRALPHAASYEFVAAGVSQVADAVAELERRRRSARDRQSQSEATTIFDKADILLVDYDLLRVSSDSYLTGEVVAYLARCYSSCGLIVGLNQFGDNSFDLTLTRDATSFADLNVGSVQATHQGLWGGSSTGFWPWKWPSLGDAHAAFKRRVRSVRQALDRQIAAYLALEHVETLPREVTEFIEVPDRALGETTFRDFVLLSGNGLRRKDVAADGQIARIAAARIAKWLEEIVLPTQDTLIDAPHLVTRLPEVLSGSLSDVATWNATCRRGHGRAGVVDDIGRFEFKRKDWVSRPTWLWRAMRDSNVVDGLRAAAAPKVPPLVFCEDLSRFVDRSEAREFVAGVPSTFNRRWVADATKVRGLTPTQRSDLKAVAYEPEVRLAL